jgi:hypothetical protein
VVEAHVTAGDAQLGASASTGSSGTYAITVATGGVAPTLYRKASRLDYLDSYAVDAMPVSDAQRAMLWIGMYKPAELAALYSRVGVAMTSATGTAVVALDDCVGNLVTGGIVEAPTAARVAYMGSDGAPDPTLTATGPVPLAVVFGAPAGDLDITVRAGDVIYRTWPTRVVANALSTAVHRP